MRVYNTETRGAVHNALKGLPGYVASEYIGSQHAGGEVVSGTRHEDLCALSFADSEFDLVLSADVLEHVPDPYAAHREVYRVLRPHGRHVFTVPFHGEAALDTVRAVQQPDGRLELLADAVYHRDPQRPREGALVYTNFGMEMLSRLEAIGFAPRVHRLHSRLMGIYGDNQLVFEAVKR